MNARKYSYTLSDIGRLTGQTDQQVRYQVRAGYFDPKCLLSVATYVIGKRMLFLCRVQEEADGC
jgi:hypothetical protein